jgi:lambda family phage portal protein
MSRRKRKTFIDTFDQIRADYDMSRESRFVRRRTGLAPQGNTADYHYRVEQHYYDDIEKARDMDRNDSIVSQTVTRSVDNIVQDGFTVEPQTGDAGVDNELWARWKEWSESADDCDAQAEFTFHDFERFNCRQMLVDGDIVHVGTQEGMLQAWEGHQVRTHTTRDNTVFGVTMDDLRRRVSYWLIADPINPNRSKKQEIELPVRDEAGNRQIFHVYNPKRMSQTRGVTAFAPIFAVAGMRDDIDFAMLVQRQVASCFAIFRKRQYLPEVPHLTPGYGEGTTEISGTGETRYIENIAPGMEVIGQPGEELQGFSPDIPGGGYEFQLKTILQTIGTNLGLPLCLVLMDGSETNFSGWRGAVDEARKGFKSNQRNLIKRFHEPVWRWKVRQWLEDDAALRAVAGRSDVNILSHHWSAPVWQYIDPVGDAQGDQIRLQNGLISPRRLHAERGRDWEVIADETIADMEYAITKAKSAAQRINAQFTDAPIHWRELISLPMPTGIQMSMQDPQVVQQQAEAQAAEEAATVDPAAQVGAGEYKEISRQQWNRNRKAIMDIITELAEKKISQTMAEVMLGGLGLSNDSIAKLIDDAADGTIDNPPAEEPV